MIEIEPVDFFPTSLIKISFQLTGIIRSSITHFWYFHAILFCICSYVVVIYDK